MNTRRLAIVLIIALAALGFWGVRLNALNSEADNEIADLKKKLAATQHLASVARTQGLKQTGDLAGGPAAPGNDGAAPEKEKSPILQMAEIAMKNPAMKAMQANAMKTMMKNDYKDFMDGLDLTPEQRDSFVALLGQKMSGASDVGLKLLDPNLSPDEKAAVQKQVKDAQDASDADIRQFFNNDEVYASYQTYTAQQGERTQVQSLGGDLNTAGLPLNPDQSTALVNLMYNARTNFKSTVVTNDLTGPMSLSDDQMTTYFNEQAQLQQQMIDGAAQILSPEQLQVFAKNQASQLEQQKAGLTMMKQMMAPASPSGGGK